MIQPETWQPIETQLRLDWSPEQISNWLQRTGRAAVSLGIYNVLIHKKAGGALYAPLRCKKQRKKLWCQRAGSQLSDRINIDDQPAIVAQRSRLEDWEIDTIFSPSSGG